VGSAFLSGAQNGSGSTDTEPAAATRMARFVTPVTRLGRTCDSENAYRSLSHVSHLSHLSREVSVAGWVGAGDSSVLTSICATTVTP